jgi:hypothetical protein
MSEVTLAAKSGTYARPSCLREVRAVPRLCVLYPGIRLTTEEKITGKKAAVSAADRCLLVTIRYVNLTTLRVALTSLSVPVSVGSLRETWVNPRSA